MAAGNHPLAITPCRVLSLGTGIGARRRARDTVVFTGLAEIG